MRKNLLRATFIALMLLVLGNSLQSQIIFVDSSATSGGNTGITWADAYLDLQSALTTAVIGDSIFVAKGTYLPGTIRTDDFDMVDSVKAFGGFPSGGSVFATRDWIANLTILSGDIGIAGDSLDNSYHVVSGNGVDNGAGLDGFVIEEGLANGSGNLGRGGGIFNSNGSPTFINCLIRNNTASSRGGGALNQSSSSIYINCLFVGNNCPGRGGGIAGRSTGNTTLLNCTFWGNTAGGTGGAGVIEQSGTSFTVSNCIFWSNPSGANSEMTVFGPATSSVTFSDVRGGFTGIGNVNIDPLFVDTNTVDLRLRLCSPLVDAGTNAGAPFSDFAGNGRPFDGDGDLTATVDIGAYETQSIGVSPTVNFAGLPSGICLDQAAVTLTGNQAPNGVFLVVPATAGLTDNGNGTATFDPAIAGQDTFEIIYFYSDNNSCQNADTQTVQVDSLPIVILSPIGPLVFCSGDSVPLIGSSGGTYQWFLNGNLIPGATDTIHLAKITGNYNMLRTQNGCSDSAAVGISVTVNPLPNVSIAPAGPDTICPGNTILLTGTSGSGHQWFLNGDTIVGAIANTITADSSGWYNLIVTDGNGCMDSASLGNKIFEGDVTNPIAGCSDTSLFLDVGGNASITANDINNGSSDNCGIASLVLAQTAFSCVDTGANSINLTVNDVNGNSSICVSTITVIDNTSPSAVCNDTTLFLDAGGNVSVAGIGIDNGSSDNCGIASYSLDQSSFVCADTGVNSVNLTVTDVSGNSNSCAANITVIDSTSPNALCQDTILYLSIGGNASLLAADVDAGSNDNCGVGSLSLSQLAFTCTDAGVQVETLTVFDISGNQAACISNITVLDSFPPVATCQNLTLAIQTGGSVALVPANLDNGSSDNCSVDSIFTDIQVFICADTGVNVVKLFVRDVSGNLDSCNSMVTVLDTFPISAICTDTTLYLDASGIASLTAISIGYQTTGNCGIDSLVLDNSAFNCSDTASIQVIQLTVFAPSGNDSCLANVTVIDSILPAAICKDTLLYLNTSGMAGLMPSDLDAGSIDNCGIAFLTLDDSLWACVDSGSFIAILTAVDGSGLTDTCHAQVTLLDSIGPRAVCATGVEELDQSLLVFDTQVGGVAIAQSFQAGTSGYLSRLRINTRTANFPDSVTFQIKTGLDPTIGAGTVIASKRLLINDGVFVFTDVLFPGFPPITAGNSYIYVITVDGPGNLILSGAKADSNAYLPGEAWADIFGTNSWLATKRDLNFEEFILPFGTGADTVHLDGSGIATISTANVDLSSFDNCALDTLILDNSAFTCADTGLNFVTLTVFDDGGRVDSCTTTILVLDTTAPIPLCHDTTLYLNGSGMASVAAALLNSNSIENCGIQSFSLDQDTFVCAETGVNPQVLTITDVNGNSSICNLNITVVDTVLPTPACLDTSLYLDGSGSAALVAANLDAGGTDNCSISSVSVSQSAFACVDTGIQMVSLVFTDASGNLDSCMSNVTVFDTVRPTISCQNLSVGLDSMGQASITAAAVNNGSFDNCSIDTMMLDQNSFVCADTGTNTVVLTVLDASGNTNICQSIITIFDTVPPIPVCRSINIQLPVLGWMQIFPAMVDSASSDNCGISSRVVSQDSFTCADIGVNPVFLLVWDGSGNLDSCALNVTVEDTAGITIRSVDLGPDSIHCGNDSILLDAGAGFSSYLWSTTEFSQTIIIQDTGNYSVVVTDIFGCQGNDTIRFNDGIFLDSVITVLGKSVVCAGDTIWLIADSGYVSYQWSNGATNPTIAVTASGIFTVIALTPDGCGVTETLDIVFQPFPVPAPFILPPGPLDLCNGDTLDLDAGAGYFSYLWTSGNTSRFQQVTNAGSYGVTVFNGAGCFASSDPVVVSMLPGPGTPVITQSNDTLYATAANAYQWYVGGSAIIGATNQSWTPTISGFYTVEVWDTDGCAATSAVFTFIVGTEPLLGESLKLYPNPVSDHLNLELVLVRSENVSITLYDLTGRILFSNEIESVQNLETGINLAGISRGMYILRVEAGSRAWSSRIEKL